MPQAAPVAYRILKIDTFFQSQAIRQAFLREDIKATFHINYMDNTQNSNIFGRKKNMNRYCIIALTCCTITSACTKTHKPKADTSIAPKFVTEQHTFHQNAQLILQGDTISAMNVDASNELSLDQIYAPIKSGQAVIIKYTDERRRSYTMANIGQPLDIIFLNSEKTVVHIEHQPAYSTTRFHSFEYAQYAILTETNLCAKHNIKASDTIVF